MLGRKVRPLKTIDANNPKTWGKTLHREVKRFLPKDHTVTPLVLKTLTEDIIKTASPDSKMIATIEKNKIHLWSNEQELLAAQGAKWILRAIIAILAISTVGMRVAAANEIKSEDNISEVIEDCSEVKKTFLVPENSLSSELAQESFFVPSNIDFSDINSVNIDIESPISSIETSKEISEISEIKNSEEIKETEEENIETVTIPESTSLKIESENITTPVETESSIENNKNNKTVALEGENIWVSSDKKLSFYYDTDKNNYIQNGITFTPEVLDILYAEYLKWENLPPFEDILALAVRESGGNPSEGGIDTNGYYSGGLFMFNNYGNVFEGNEVAVMACGSHYYGETAAKHKDSSVWYCQNWNSNDVQLSIERLCAVVSTDVSLGWSWSKTLVSWRFGRYHSYINYPDYWDAEYNSLMQIKANRIEIWKTNRQ